jgi:hypothetical protein
MIPAFTEEGLLPPGIYQATLDEFKDRFVIFQRSDRRFRIFAQLEKARSSGTGQDCDAYTHRWEFVSAKPEPNDFDSIVVLDPSIVGKPLRPFEYSLVSRQIARRVFGGDIMPALEIQLLCNNT